MASKNLGAVIQRAISDGAFRRQLQSDPAAALRGFNLTSDEIAAVRSGDSSKLMSLGVDQRMSKAFSIGAVGSGEASRKAMSGDLTGSTHSAVSDTSAGARDGVVIGEPTTGARGSVSAPEGGSVNSAVRASDIDGNLSGTRAADKDTNLSGGMRAADKDTNLSAGTRAADNDTNLGGPTRSADADGNQITARGSVSAPGSDAYRQVNDPDNAGTLRGSAAGPQGDAYRAVNDPDNAGGLNANVSAPQGDSFRPIHDPDNTGTVASRMQDANTDLPGSDVQHDPGFIDSGHSAFIPSDSADVQREALDGQHGTGGDALGHTGDTGDEHSWG